MVSAANEAEVNESLEKTGETTAHQTKEQPDEKGKDTQSPSENAGESGISSDAGTDLCTLQVMNSANAKITENAVNSAGQTFTKSQCPVCYVTIQAAIYPDRNCSQPAGTISFSAWISPQMAA